MSTETQFETIVRAHQERVFRTLVRLLGSHEHVEDLAQQVFWRLYRALPQFRGEAMLTTYLYRITVNVAHDERKRRLREDKPLTSLSDEDSAWERRLSQRGSSPQEQLIERETHAAIEVALQHLSSVERAVLVLYHQEEQSYQQIAEALRLPLNTVRTHLHRGRNRLRDTLRQTNARRG